MRSDVTFEAGDVNMKALYFTFLLNKVRLGYAGEHINNPQMLSTSLNKKSLIVRLSFSKCAHLGSNQGPKDYESSTLTD